MPDVMPVSDRSSRPSKLDRIILGDIRLKGPFINDRGSISYTLEIAMNTMHFFKANFPQNSGRVLEHLLKNPGTNISEREILEISEWADTKPMEYLMAPFQIFSAHYELVKVGSSYRMQKRSSDEPKPIAQATWATTSLSSDVGRPPNVPYAGQKLQERYARIPIDPVKLKAATNQILLDIDEVKDITQMPDSQLDVILANERAASFVITRGGQTRFLLVPFAQFLYNQGKGYLPAAERLYSVYLSRTRV